MSDSILNIIINTVKRGGGDKETITGIVKLKNSFKELTGVNLSTVTALAAVGSAISKLTQYTNMAIEKTDAYVSSMTDSARMTGMTVEEYSRLAQAADDVFLSQDKLANCLRIAMKNGVDVSIEGIKNLSTQYLALNPGVERSQFLMQTFGKNSVDMGKLLELSAEGIDTAMLSVEDYMVVTQKAQEVVYAYKRSQDALNDSIDGFNYSVGYETMPSVTNLNNRMSEMVNTVNESGAASKTLGFLVEGLGQAVLGVQVLFGGYTTEVTEASKATDDLGTSVVATSDDIAKITQLFEAFTEKLLFNKLAATLDAAAATDLAWKMGLINEETYNTYQTIDALTEKYDTNKDGVISLTEKTAGYDAEVLALQAHINALQDKNVTITTTHVTNFVTNYAAGDIGEAERAAGRDLNGNGIIGRAAGGPVSENTPYIIGEKGPELFVPSVNGNVIPNHQLIKGDTHITNHFSISGAGDPDAVVNKIMQKIKLQIGGRV